MGDFVKLDFTREVLILNLKGDFPALMDRKIIYFDTACTSLKPTSVIEGTALYSLQHPSCHRRTPHRWGRQTNEKVELTRKTVQKFINAKEIEEIIFTRNTTEGINIIANGFKFKQSDSVLTTSMEHNSNFLPWQNLQYKKIIKHKILNIDINDINKAFDLDNFKNHLTKDIKLISIYETSHLTGTILPIKEIIEIAHENNIYVLIDAAQSLLHHKIDVQKLDIDFMCFSATKMLGPTGVGILYGKKYLLEKINPLILGGNTVENVTENGIVFTELPHRLEPGLQNYSGIIGFKFALDYIKKVSYRKIQENELIINNFLTEELIKSNRISIIGPVEPSLRTSIINLLIENLDSGQLSIMLDSSNHILTRSGVHCSHFWFNQNKIEPSLRLSIGPYNTLQDAEVFIDAVNKLLKFY